MDFEGTEYEFLESVVWLAILLSLIVGAWLIERADIPVSPATWAIAGAAIGGVLFAGSLAERDYMSEPGLFAGALVALVGFAAARVFLGGAPGAAGRARRGRRGHGRWRLIADARRARRRRLSPCWSSRVAYLALAFCAWVLLVRRRRAGQKYEGLRILR